MTRLQRLLDEAEIDSREMHRDPLGVDSHKRQKFLHLVADMFKNEEPCKNLGAWPAVRACLVKNHVSYSFIIPDLYASIHNSQHPN
jgi:hypothetical protein